jgi:hypothetical protein
VGGVALEALEAKEDAPAKAEDVKDALDALRSGPWASVPAAGARRRASPRRPAEDPVSPRG